ncbi:BnaA05g13030D [Brassica napus]|uniref:Glutamate receptor n=1 Tax=Brassica napus TaxID=3708 RepID=A0A078HMJ6_BRANA|nr:BnaA05g13030D [Brassica napus]
MMKTTKKTRNTFLSHFVLFLSCFVLMEVGLGQSPTSEIKVGVVLDLKTTFSKICLTSINMSLSDFYGDHPNYRTRLALHARDSMEDVVQASAAGSTKVCFIFSRAHSIFLFAALDLIKNEQVSAIIGPRSSMQAEFMIRMANKSQVPIITFSATSPLLTSIKSPYFYRATLDDSCQVEAIAAVVNSFGWRSVVAIYVDNELGKGIMHSLSDALQDVEVHRSVISTEASDDQILKELYKLKTRQTRVFVIHMASRLGFRVLQKARKIGMLEKEYVWLLSNGMTNMMTHDGRSLETMQGVLGVRNHVRKSKELEDFRLRWKRKYQKDNPSTRDDVELNVFALWAYDSITALATAVEKTNTNNMRYDNFSALSNNTTDLGTLGVSLYGPSLLEALSRVEFKGLAGEFSLVNRQLVASTFDIINVVGNEERIIGTWTPRDGLMNTNSKKTTLFSNERLGPVVWPGSSYGVPKGWEVPTDGKKIKVGVPVKQGFFNFVEVTTNPITNVTTAKGYAIDIFEAALKKLPYSVIPRYYRIESPEDNYNYLVHQVYDGTLDAVVGDITITANRSMYVDFTLPYTESGVSMLVPLRDNENKNTWVFLKPWSLDLWITTGCFFVLIGFIVWLFEHRVNSDFRGPPHHQIGTSFWFSFSTMVFAHREKVVSNLARFVVISYTANLTSFLTVQRLEPRATSVEDLIRNGESVGFQHGAFVKDTLKGLGFKESQLKSFGSAEKCDELLSNGTSKGGIAAAFDEVAYLKAILSKYCSKYAIVEPSFKTAGFGFAFPKNSPMTGDVSRAILNLTQGEEMAGIENKWFNRLSLASECPDPKTALSSNRLSLSSFWGLFLIAGIASFLAFLIFVGHFLYEHRHTLCDNTEGSLWRKLTSLLRTFDAKDTKSHTFKNSAVHNVSSPVTQCTPSPSTLQMRPWPRSMSLNREFELRRASFFMSEERLTTQAEHNKHGESDIESGSER